MSIQNVATIQSMYAAFGAGDVATILAAQVDDVVWDFAGGFPAAVPWHQPARGRAALPGFFQAFGGSVELHAFEPREFVHCGPHVVVDVHLEYTVRATGRRVNQDQLHWWSFTPEGKVSRLRHYEDTRQVVAACGG